MFSDVNHQLCLHKLLQDVFWGHLHKSLYNDTLMLLLDTQFFVDIVNIVYHVSVHVVPFTNGIHNTQHGIHDTQCSNGQEIHSTFVIILLRSKSLNPENVARGRGLK